MGSEFWQMHQPQLSLIFESIIIDSTTSTIIFIMFLLLSFLISQSNISQAYPAITEHCQRQMGENRFTLPTYPTLLKKKLETHFFSQKTLTLLDQPYDTRSLL